MTLEHVQNTIRNTCADCNRNPAEITLIAVSKTQPPEKITPLLKNGHRAFGENRVQEAAEKWPDLRAQYPDITLHAIGHLQTNKVRDAVALFDVIHTLDREKLAEALAEEIQKQNRKLPCFIQVNTGNESQKGGVDIKNLEPLYRFCTEKAGLNVTGLMCLPPVDDVAALHFALLHKLSRELDLSQLSMGMSTDFEEAIRFGATHLRVGSAVFGER